MKCPTDWISAAVNDQLPADKLDRLQKHLTTCDGCRTRLDEATADTSWWNDASRFLDESVLSDPQADTADSSSCDARLFDDDDPIGELRAMGAIDAPTHPEMLGKLGRYTIEREIGAGGMGVVLKAHDAELSRIVAIKVLAPHLARSGAAKQRFIREGRAAAAVVHDNIVAIHEVDTNGKLPTLVMRYVDGISLQRYVDLYGPLSVHDALRIGSQTASGLAAAHRQGIIHRDVKPANILVNHSCNRAWISDFGLARAVDDASLTRTGFIAGTPHYMSPEQARGGDVGPSSDLFSLGAVLYFMFAARPPWRAERSLAVLHRIVQHEHRSLRQINADIPRQVSDLVDRLLRKEITDRPESATQVQQELEAVLSRMQNPGLTLTDEVHPASQRAAWWTRPWFVGPVAAGLTAAGFIAAGWQSSPAETPVDSSEPIAQGSIENNAYARAYEVPTQLPYPGNELANPVNASPLSSFADEPSQNDWAPVSQPSPQPVNSQLIEMSESFAPPESFAAPEAFAIAPSSQPVEVPPFPTTDPRPSTNVFQGGGSHDQPSLPPPPFAIPQLPQQTLSTIPAGMNQEVLALEQELHTLEVRAGIAPNSIPAITRY